MFCFPSVRMFIAKYNHLSRKIQIKQLVQGVRKQFM